MATLNFHACGFSRLDAVWDHYSGYVAYISNFGFSLINGVRIANTRPRYGWSHPDGADNKTERFVAVLEIPHVDSPQTAVKMAIYSDIKKGKL